LQVTLRFENGAIGTITYVATGSNRYPKETFDAAGNGRNVQLENFRRATVWSGWRRRSRRAFGKLDKGQQGQLRAFVNSVRQGKPRPIPGASLAAARGPPCPSRGDHPPGGRQPRSRWPTVSRAAGLNAREGSTAGLVCRP